MTQTTEIRVGKSDLRVRDVASVELSPADGQALVRVDRFALTANNVTYGVFGDAMGYWRFFPAPEGWGVVPVWGFGTVVESRAAGVAEGERFYGYWPSASHALLTPGRVGAHGFADAAPHRQGLAAVYNSYLPATPGVDEDRVSLFRPLYGTAFVLDAFLADAGDADAVVLTSASSKTALGLAEALSRRGVEVIGMTGAANRGFVAATGYYARVLDYAEVDALDADAPTTLVDFSGDAGLKLVLHHRLRALTASHIVGATHWDAAPDAEPLPGPAPRMFFAPTVWEAKANQLGAAAFEASLQAGMTRFLATTERWLTVARESGAEAYGARLDALLGGRADPAVGVVLGV